MRVLFFTVGGARAFQNLPEDVWELSSAQLGERYRTGAFTVVEYFQVDTSTKKKKLKEYKKRFFFNNYFDSLFHLGIDRPTQSV